MQAMRCTFAALLLSASCWPALGQEPIQPALPVNEAALERIEALGSNEAAIVGLARVVGEFNHVARRFHLDRTGPRGRDFTIKMVWAPERRRALFCGANHGVPHRLNDVWEFDLAALAWIMLYGPDNPRDYTGLGKDYSDVEFKDGVLITRRGGPAVIAHTWWGLTYDPDQTTWTRLQPEGDDLPVGKKLLAYFDPARNVFVVIEDTSVWVYRYRSR